MAKEVIMHKIIIDYNTDGTFLKGVAQYQIKIDGAMNNIFNTTSIDGAGPVASLNAILAQIKNKVKQVEGVE